MPLQRDDFPGREIDQSFVVAVPQHHLIPRDTDDIHLFAHWVQPVLECALVLAVLLENSNALLPDVRLIDTWPTAPTDKENRSRKKKSHRQTFHKRGVGAAGLEPETSAV